MFGGYSTPSASKIFTGAVLRVETFGQPEGLDTDAPPTLRLALCHA